MSSTSKTMKTLEQILIDVNSYLDLTAELPSGDDLDVRSNFARQSVDEWGSAYRWKQLRNETRVFVTGASLGLASNFREFTSTPYIGTQEYPEIMPEERYSRSSSDTFVIIYGNNAVGKSLYINGLPSSGATLSYTWQQYPSNMATLSSICEVSDPTFVTKKTISFVLQSRLDERFPTMEAEANRTLQNMIGREMVQTPGGSLSVRRVGSSAYGLGRR